MPVIRYTFYIIKHVCGKTISVGFPNIFSFVNYHYVSKILKQFNMASYDIKNFVYTRITSLPKCGNHKSPVAKGLIGRIVQ